MDTVAASIFLYASFIEAVFLSNPEKELHTFIRSQGLAERDE